MKQSPFITKKKKVAPVRRGVLQQFVGIGQASVEGLKNIPGDMAKTAVDSVGMKSSPVSADAHSKHVTDYLYEGKSLTPKQREEIEQREQTVPTEIEKWKREVQKLKSQKQKAGIADVTRIDAPEKRKPSIQEILEQEKQQEEQKKLEIEKNKPKPVALPSSGVSKKPGLKNIKMRQKSKESKIAYKGAG